MSLATYEEAIAFLQKNKITTEKSNMRQSGLLMTQQI
jgi:hypothetical protein